MHGARGISYKAVVRKRGVTKTKTFKRAALARQWITATEAAIDSDHGLQEAAGRHRGNFTRHVTATGGTEPDLPLEQRPWYTLDEACALLGLRKSSGSNLIHLERFPVPHEKLGRRNVVLKEVMAAYFDAMRERGLQVLRDQLTRRRQP